MAAALSPPGLPTGTELEDLLKSIRLDILKMTYCGRSGHPGGSMSAAEMMVALYWGGIRVDPKDPRNPDRDRFILSKGHTCPVQYSVLARRGFFDPAELSHFRHAGHLLQGHSDIKVPGVDMSAGSLGMGLGYGNGCALAARVQGRDYHTYVMLGDGELQEGNVWESAMTSAHRKLDNVTAIIDYNKIQIDGYVSDVKGLEPLVDKWRAFGWHVLEIDGHDVHACHKALTQAREHTGEPTAIVMHTLKGNGVSFMADKAEYHGRSLTDEEMSVALAELGETFSKESVLGGWT